MFDDYEHDRRNPIGYILAERAAEGGYHADWDGVVHPTLEAAWNECRKANGEDWWDAMQTEGITHAILRMADYLPYALFLMTPKPPHPKPPKKEKKKPVVAYPKGTKVITDFELQSVSIDMQPNAYGMSIKNATFVTEEE